MHTVVDSVHAGDTSFAQSVAAFAAAVTEYSQTESVVGSLRVQRERAGTQQSRRIFTACVVVGPVRERLVVQGQTPAA